MKLIIAAAAAVLTFSTASAHTAIHHRHGLPANASDYSAEYHSQTLRNAVPYDAWRGPTSEPNATATGGPVGGLGS